MASNSGWASASSRPSRGSRTTLGLALLLLLTGAYADPVKLVPFAAASDLGNF